MVGGRGRAKHGCCSFGPALFEVDSVCWFARQFHIATNPEKSACHSLQTVRAQRNHVEDEFSRGICLCCPFFVCYAINQDNGCTGNCCTRFVHNCAHNVGQFCLGTCFSKTSQRAERNEPYKRQKDRDGFHGRTPSWPRLASLVCRALGWHRGLSDLRMVAASPELLPGWLCHAVGQRHPLVVGNPHIRAVTVHIALGR